MPNDINDKNKRRYFNSVPRRHVYGGLALLSVIVLGLFLFVPHYKPLALASDADINQAHKDIIRQYFVASTTCRDDTRSHAERVKEFNKYFKVNKYANRAVIRGCNDTDFMLAKDDSGKWQKTDVNVILSLRLNPKWQKECLIDDITTADTKVRPENKSIDSFNYNICNSLLKESYLRL